MSGDYGSGVGSLPLNNIEYIKFLTMFIKQNNIRTVVDFGCGDWQFSRFIDWNSARYTGFDVVEQIITTNQTTFGRPNIQFRVFTSDTELPNTDLLICKDVFQHIPIGLIKEFLDVFRERARFLLITNDDWPAEHLTNTEIDEGGWRQNVDREPFCEARSGRLILDDRMGWLKPTRRSTSLIIGKL